MRGSRFVHQQLSNGALVSGEPKHHSRENLPTVRSFAAPYTSADDIKSEEFGKMFDIPREKHTGRNSRTSSVPQSARRTSVNLPVTGLITGGAGRRSEGEQENSRRISNKRKILLSFGNSVTVVKNRKNYWFRVSKTGMWICGAALSVGAVLGVLWTVTTKSWIILVVVGGIAAILGLVFCWNLMRREKELEAFLRDFPDTNLQHATPGQLVKVTGVVTCGSIPLETSYQGISRCVYVSTELHEYRDWKGKPANPHHRRLTWGLRYAERHAADFYIADYQSGARALVRAGHGSRVVPFVKTANKIDLTTGDREISSASLSWLEDHHLSHDDRIMRIQEGFIKEASTISVIGTLQRHGNMKMIVPLAKPISTGFQWKRCLFPIDIRGLLLLGDKNPNDVVIIV